MEILQGNKKLWVLPHWKWHFQQYQQRKRFSISIQLESFSVIRPLSYVKQQPSCFSGKEGLPPPTCPPPAASNTGANLCKHKENSLCWFLALVSCCFSLHPLPWPLGDFTPLFHPPDDFHTYLSFPPHPQLHFFLLLLETGHEKSRTSAFPPEVSYPSAFSFNTDHSIFSFQCWGFL